MLWENTQLQNLHGEKHHFIALRHVRARERELQKNVKASALPAIKFTWLPHEFNAVVLRSTYLSTQVSLGLLFQGI